MSQRKSQNGWPAYSTTEHFVRATAQLRDGKTFKFWAANDDVGVVLAKYIERYDAEVEEVSGPELDDWGWADRLVRGAAEIVSNHGSATAIDLNALKYPLGTRNMSQTKLSKIRAIRRALTDNSGRPVLRLGADYVGRVDQMHVEIDANAAKVKQAADKIREADMALSEQDVQKIAEKSGAAFLASKVKLTEAAARNMGGSYKEDDLVSVSFLLQWGGPGLARLENRIKKIEAALAAGTSK